MSDIEYFTPEFILNRVATELNCFMCGADFSEVSSINNEHVIPYWLLKYGNESQGAGILPNGATVPYPKRLLKCCTDCNTEWKLKLEDDVSVWLKVSELKFPDTLMGRRKLSKLSFWMLSIFCKQQIFDLKMKYELDKRKNDDRSVGHNYDIRHLTKLLNWLRMYVNGICRQDEPAGMAVIVPTFNVGKDVSIHPKLSVLESAFSLRVRDIQILSYFDLPKQIVDVLKVHYRNHNPRDRRIPEDQISELFSLGLVARRKITDRSTETSTEGQEACLRSIINPMSYSELMGAIDKELWGHFTLFYCSQYFIACFGKSESFNELSDAILKGHLRFMDNEDVFFDIYRKLVKSEEKRAEEQLSGLRSRCTDYLTTYFSDGTALFE